MEYVTAKNEEEVARRVRRTKLLQLNRDHASEELGKALDSSLRRHTALITRMRQSPGAENHDQIMKEISALTLEKYVDEIAGAIVEGISRCKTEKDVWSAVEIISAMHRRFPSTFTTAFMPLVSGILVGPNKTALAVLAPEQREKEDSGRVARQRPVLRVCSELALVGIIKDAPNRSGGEWTMKVVKDLLSNDPTLSSLPLLTTFLKFFSTPFLGISAPSQKQAAESQPGELSDQIVHSSRLNGHPTVNAENEKEELVEKDIRDRFKRMCEGYFESVSKKLVIEHKRLQEQDRRNHEAYIRSGEIFEDRQQAYEKMTKGYEKIFSNCQTLSELLYLPMPSLPTEAQKTDSINIGMSSGMGGDEEGDDILYSSSKWEDEEERRFFEDIQDLKDFVPRSVLGVDGEEKDSAGEDQSRKQLEEEEMKRLAVELEKLGEEDTNPVNRGDVPDDAEDEDDMPTPMASPPRTPTPPLTPTMAPQGPSQLLTALLARLPDATNRTLIDQAAVDFAFLNSKAACKRLVKFLTQVPRNRTDLLPHYSRLVATLNRYMPGIGTDLVAVLDEEFRYLQRKKNVVVELAETRLKNIMFIANLTKFGVVPPHVILHMFKVCLDDFSGTNIDNLALLLEGCGRFLLRTDDTKERFSTMVELMRRKQSRQHLDQRQLLILENAYYQANPPERAPREEKQRTTVELFIRHLIYDVLTKKTIDKVLKLIRKLDWEDPIVLSTLHKSFSKPWKIKFGNINLLAMLVYDLQRYHPEFSIAVVDQVLEDIRRGMEQNVYKINQRRVATIKFLGELYIYRAIGSSIVFDTLWSLVTFGHHDGRPLPGQSCPIDMPDDFFRVRLVCVLLDACGMCFDRGSQKKKLDSFLTFFQLYVFCKEPLPMEIDFTLHDSFDAIRPKMTLFNTFEEAANAVDEMFNVAMQNAGLVVAEGEDSGDESDGEGERPGAHEDDEEDGANPESPTEERPASPDTLVVLSSMENVGPSEEEDADFAKELAKMVTESATESRKVDRRTVLSMWDSGILAAGVRKKRADDDDVDRDGSEVGLPDVMKFTLISKKGNKPLARSLPVPADSALAVQTRSQQMQEKVEQQHLKQLVLNYEQREEEEELRALEARTRGGAIKIRYVG